VLKVDGKTYKGKQMRDLVYDIRGPAGHSVELTVLRDAQVQTLRLTRERIAWAQVKDERLPGEIGLLSIAAFTEKTPAMVRASLERLAGAHVRGLVIDLRDNGGGVFDKVVEAAGLLMPPGKTVVTALHRGGERKDYRTQGTPLMSGIPVAVLVDKETSSGAEVLAAALHEGIGARAVGEKTLGKWNVQMIEPLKNGYVLRYTVAHFRSAAGEDLDGKGLVPDVLVPMAEESSRLRQLPIPARLEADVQLRAALQLVRR
jgi:carboxyl-terminal processing protease